jgi:ArsR family transcriptional regulator, arsenate/arsenite/antimonite-responsive transcriptional repressor
LTIVNVGWANGGRAVARSAVDERSDPVVCCAPLMGATISPEDASATAALFKALSDPTRVRIVNLLANSDDPVCVCDLNANFELSQPTMSHHLKRLVSAGLLSREQRGTWAYFSINDRALERLADVFKHKEERR